MAEPSTTSSLSTAAFVEVLKRSQLIDVSQLPRILKTILASVGEDRSAALLAEHLITSGHLTKWQASQLLKGKYRGFILGKYRFRKPLGRGGMGVVFEGEHMVLGTRVAIKILPKDRGDSDKAISRFLAEARAAAKLNHPHVLRVHDCDIFEGRRFMVMELIEGANLGELVQRNGPLTYRNAIELLRQAASGLAFAHDQGVIHRDVKPHNFMVDRSGQLKVADLGLALFQVDSPERYTQDGNVAVLGTVDYVAPEQAWDSRKVDRRADMYSLGCTLYFMLTGKPPFDAGSMAQKLAKHQASQPIPIAKFRPDCPPPIVQLCEKMMAKKPGERVQQMQEVVVFCEALIPRLQGSNADLVGIASQGRSKGSLGTDSSIHSLGISLAHTDASFDTLPSSELNDPATSNESSNVGDLGFFDQALMSQPQLSAASAPNAPANDYWKAAKQAKPASPKPKRDPKAVAESRKNMVLLGVGLSVAFLSIAITAWQVMNPPKPDSGPKIKTYEDSGTGQKVIVVQE